MKRVSILGATGSVGMQALDVCAQCGYAPYALTAGRNARALADAVYEKRKEEENVLPVRQEGYEQGQWIVMDYGDVMVHIFRQEEREFYNLERLWLQEKNFSFHADSHEDLMR